MWARVTYWNLEKNQTHSESFTVLYVNAGWGEAAGKKNFELLKVSLFL